MLRILGMSHAISVLRAIGADAGISHHNWNVELEHPQWLRQALPQAFHDLGFDALEVFLIRPTMNWQARLDRNDSGGEVLAAHPGLWTLLEALTTMPADGSQALISFLGGNDHSVMSLVDSGEPYDFALPGAERFPLVFGRQPIDVKFVASELDRRMNPTLAMLTAVRFKQPNLRILHVMPPPPIGSEHQIYREPEVFREVLDRYGVTPLSVRMKVYLLYCRQLEVVLKRLNIEAIHPPVAATDEAGALKEEFAFGCTHGNETYGKLVAAQLVTQFTAPLG